MSTETDPAFRDAVMQWAERMHVFDRLYVPDARQEQRWKQIADRIAELPQKRIAGIEAGTAKAGTIRNVKPRTVGMGLQSHGGRRGMAIAFGVIAAFVLGYLTGRF